MSSSLGITWPLLGSGYPTGGIFSLTCASVSMSLCSSGSPVCTSPSELVVLTRSVNSRQTLGFSCLLVKPVSQAADMHGLGSYLGCAMKEQRDMLAQSHSWCLEWNSIHHIVFEEGRLVAALTKDFGDLASRKGNKLSCLFLQVSAKPEAKRSGNELFFLPDTLSGPLLKLSSAGSPGSELHGHLEQKTLH